VRISFQTSGGRGEYELAEQSNGIDAAQAVDHDLILRIGAHELATGIEATHLQGKYRLRLKGGDIQVGRQVAAALLMPKPVRDQNALPPGARRLVTSSYIVEDITIVDAELTATQLRVSAVDVDFSGTGRVDVARRSAELDLIAKGREALPGDLPSLLAQHEAATKAGTIRGPVEQLVGKIQRSLAQAAAPLGIDYEEIEDPVPALLQAIGAAVIPVAEPKPAQPLPAEPVDVRRREVKRARAWLRRRPAASAKFSRDVRAAYNHSCVICGERYPPTPHTNSGVDADHIMPWSDYEIDVVPNGLCLCKSHHWMVDEGLLLVEYSAVTGEYHVVVSEWVQGLAASGFSVAAVQACAGAIPVGRLPANAALRPNPELLSRAAQLIA
jgi:hypothetical protein